MSKVEITHFHLFCGLGGGAMGQTLLLAWSGQSFVLDTQPIWVRPIALAASVDVGIQQ